MVKRKIYFFAYTLVISYLLNIPKLYAQEYPDGWCGSIFTSVGCENLSKSNNVGGSFPSLFDAFNLNPSTLPIYNTPVGFEIYRGSDAFNFALLKGVKNLGLGISEKLTDMTFFSPIENYKRDLLNVGVNYSNAIFDPRTNLGTSVSVWTFGDFLNITAGLSFKFNPENQQWSDVFGLGLKSPYFSLAFSEYSELTPEYDNGFYTTSQLDRYTSIQMALKLPFIYIDYSINNKTAREFNTSMIGNGFNRTERILTKILSAKAKFGNLDIVYGTRTQYYSGTLDSTINNLLVQYGISQTGGTHQLLGINYKYNRFLTLGYHYNYFLDESSSFLVQFRFARRRGGE